MYTNYHLQQPAIVSQPTKDTDSKALIHNVGRIHHLQGTTHLAATQRYHPGVIKSLKSIQIDSETIIIFI